MQKLTNLIGTAVTLSKKNEPGNVSAQVVFKWNTIKFSQYQNQAKTVLFTLEWVLAKNWI